MHLRSCKSIVSGQSKPSRVSTQGSGTGNNPRLSPIVEDLYLGETESTTSTSISMASDSEGMSEWKRLSHALHASKRGSTACSTTIGM